MKTIVFENVSYKYINYEGAEKVALDELSLEIKHGEFVAIVGSNGAGKSTLAKHINALILPDDGKVMVNGLDTKDDDNLWNIRKSAGMVFQNPDNQIVATIVEEDVAFGPENLGVAPTQIRQRVDNSLNTVEMYKYRGKASHMLSGGQKQRVAIAGVLALEPQIIVFDEATAMLDPRGREEVMDVALNLHKLGKTIVMITHFMEEAMMADRIIVMHEGKIAINDAPVRVFEQMDLLEELSLSVPKSVMLAQKLKEIGIDIPYTDDIDEIAERICQQV